MFAGIDGATVIVNIFEEGIDQEATLPDWTPLALEQPISPVRDGITGGAS